MTWPTGDGTAAISSWLNQGVVFALVLATLMLIGCVIVWAVGSLSANGAAAGRGRTGAALSLLAAFVLGAGFTVVQWTAGTQAAAFEGDPAEYGINDTPDIPGAWETIDLSERWTADINQVRSKDGLPPLRTDGSLTTRAISCVRSHAGQGGECPSPPGCEDGSSGALFGAWDYGPGELDKLDGPLTEQFIRLPNPWPGIGPVLTLDPSADMRSAWVALRDNANKKAVVVAMFENDAGPAQWNFCTQFN